MRTDMVTDGFVCSTATVGGMDATEKIIEMFMNLEREDINLLILNGCIISWYNVVDLNKIVDAVKLPLLCITYQESEGLEKYFVELFPNDWKYRVEVYHRNGSRISIQLKTGYTVYTRFLNMTLAEAKGILNKFTLYGSIPEPLRVARILAKSIAKAYPNQLQMVI